MKYPTDASTFGLILSAPHLNHLKIALGRQYSSQYDQNKTAAA